MRDPSEAFERRWQQSAGNADVCATASVAALRRHPDGCVRGAFDATEVRHHHLKSHARSLNIRPCVQGKRTKK